MMTPTLHCCKAGAGDAQLCGVDGPWFIHRGELTSATGPEPRRCVDPPRGRDSRQRRDGGDCHFIIGLQSAPFFIMSRVPSLAVIATPSGMLTPRPAASR